MWCMDERSGIGVLDASRLQTHWYGAARSLMGRRTAAEGEGRTVALLDTSVGSGNLGDQIIMDAVEQHVLPLFSDAFVVRVPTHDRPGRPARALLRASSLAIVGGTSMFGARMWYRPNWALGPRSTAQLPPTLFVGVGWNAQTNGPPGRGRLERAWIDPYSKWMVRRASASSFPHSVRDAMTGRQLARLGVTNWRVTGCPTTWSLTPEHCREIPTTPGPRAVLTFNYGHPDEQRDRAILRVVRDVYPEVVVWPQAVEDIAYARSIDRSLVIARPSLREFDAILASGYDYVGLRLHGGIRALQHGRRTTIVVVDNRAREMGRDWSLPVWEPTSDVPLRDLLEGGKMRVAIDRSAIDTWKRDVLRAWTGSDRAELPET